MSRRYASGAQKRKAKSERDAAAAAEELRRGGNRRARRRYPRPPKGCLATIPYAMGILGKALHEAWTDAELDARSRWRAVAELGRVVGMLYARSAMIEQLAELQQQIDAQFEPDAADVLTPASEVNWPSTSRFGDGSLVVHMTEDDIENDPDAGHEEN